MKISLHYKSDEDERLTMILKNKEFDKLTDEDLCKIVKKCSKCNADKTLKDFTKSKRGFLGRNSVCKDCVSDYAQEYYSKITDKPSKGIVQIL